jgi:hypothetical protein
MRLIHIASYVGLLVIGQTALDASPLVVAAQEGGMGPGSALIVAYVLQAGGIALGAAAAAYLVDRGSIATALIAGAVVFAGGLIAAMTAPMGALGWVIAGLGVAGSGFGLILTAAFSTAAGVGLRGRPIAIMLLLLALLAARVGTGAVVVAGPLVLTVAAAIVVAISVLLAGLSGLARTNASVGPAAAGEARHRLSGGAALLGGLLLAAGVVGTLAGADTSRVSAFALAGSLGAGSLDVLDFVRTGMVVGGLAMVVGGSTVLFRRLRPDTGLVWAGPVIGLAALTTAGMGTGLTLAVTLGGTSSGREGAVVAGLAVIGGSGFGLLLGGWWLARGGASHVVAIAGTLILLGGSALGLIALSGTASVPADVFVAAGVLGLSGFGGALVAVALRLVLAESAAHQRGLAAGAGVVAASFGSALGSLIGTGAATRWLTGDPNAIPTGVVVLAAAAVGAVAAVLRMSSRQQAGT